MKVDDREDVIARLKEALAAHPLRFAVLYGSYAAGRATPVSDLDLGVYIDGDGDFLSLAAALEEALPTYRVDLVNLRDKPALLYYEVLATGTLLEARDEAFFYREKLRVMREYLDFQPTHARILNDMYGRIERGTYGRRGSQAEGA